MLKKIAMVISCFLVVACGSVEPNLSSNQSEIVSPPTQCRSQSIDLSAYQNIKVSADGKSITAQREPVGGIVFGDIVVTCKCTVGSGDCRAIKKGNKADCVGSCSNGGSCSPNIGTVEPPITAAP